MVIKTLNDIYLDIRARLIRENRGQADMIAREICACGAGVDRAGFEKAKGLFLSAESADRIYALFGRFQNDEPLPYILGEWDFYSLTFKTPPGVLIPRPDTETLVGAALKASRKKTPSRVLDLCCGTGCIGIAFAKNAPGARVILADISPAAREAAKENIALHALSGSVYTLLLDITEGYRKALGKFDMILSNPPYIPSDQIGTLDRSVRGFEPPEALDGGPDGLSFYRVLGEKWREALNPGGLLFVECGHTQSADVKAILKRAGFKMLRVHKDLSGIERVVSARA